MFNPQLRVEKNANRALGVVGGTCVSNLSQWALAGLKVSASLKRWASVGLTEERCIRSCLACPYPLNLVVGGWQRRRKQKQVKQMVPIGIKSPLKLIIIF